MDSGAHGSLLGAKSLVHAPARHKGRTRALALALLALATCERAEDDAWGANLRRRVAGLRPLALPLETSVEGCPSTVLVNSLVPTILIASAPSGAEVRRGDELLGTTPFEMATTRLLADEGAVFDLSLRAYGRGLRPTGWRLRFEAADFGCGVEREQLPEELRRRDHFLFLVLGVGTEAPASAPSSAPAESPAERER
jgi:hypothetical protein